MRTFTPAQLREMAAFSRRNAGATNLENVAQHRRDVGDALELFAELLAAADASTGDADVRCDFNCGGTMAPGPGHKMGPKSGGPWLVCDGCGCQKPAVSGTAS